MSRIKVRIRRSTSREEWTVESKRGWFGLWEYERGLIDSQEEATRIAQEVKQELQHSHRYEIS